MPSTCDVSDVNSGYLANVETSEQTSRSFISYSHRRVDSGDIVGAGYQFRSPRPQNSWPRHIEIASEDLEPQCSAAGNLAVEVTSIPQPGPRRSGTSRNDMDSAPSIKSQVYTEADVAEFVAQRDGSQYGASGATRSDQSIASSCSSLGDEAPTMSEDEEVSDTHTPTQARPNPLNGSRASTAPPGSVVSTADGRRSLHEWPVSPMPWTTLKRKRTESTEGERTE